MALSRRPLRSGSWRLNGRGPRACVVWATWLAASDTGWHAAAHSPPWRSPSAPGPAWVRQGWSGCCPLAVYGAAFWLTWGRRDRGGAFPAARSPAQAPARRRLPVRARGLHAAGQRELDHGGGCLAARQRQAARSCPPPARLRARRPGLRRSRPAGRHWRAAGCRPARRDKRASCTSGSSSAPAADSGSADRGARRKAVQRTGLGSRQRCARSGRQTDRRRAGRTAALTSKRVPALRWISTGCWWMAARASRSRRSPHRRS